MTKEHRINNKKKHRIVKEFDNQHGRLDLYFRAHTIPAKSQDQYRSERKPSEPEHALIFLCANTGDAKQELLFGAYICAQLEDGQFSSTFSILLDRNVRS